MSGCPHKNDRYYKGEACRCRESLYIDEHGKDRMVSAKTRSWEQAEKAAQAEREKRDPALIELKSLEDRAAKEVAELAAGAAEVAHAITIDETTRTRERGREDRMEGE